jgi:hypothetical protein
MAEWTPFQNHYYSENLEAPEIEPGTSALASRNSDNQTTEAGDFGTRSDEIFRLWN